MRDGNKITIGKLWCAVYPMLVYNLIQGAVAVAFSVWFAVSGQGMQGYADSMTLIVLVGAVLSIPLFGWIYHRDVLRRRWMRQWSFEGLGITEGFGAAERPGITEGQLFWVALAGVSIAILGNNMIGLLPLGEWFESYQETSAALYSGNIWIQMLAVGLCGPIAEELIMRGLLYERLREMMRSPWAIFWSALLFGIFHGNMVQGIYAFFVGLFFAWLMEYFQTIYAPIVAHSSANLVIVILEESGALDQLYGSFGGFLLVTAASAVIFLCAFRVLRSSW